MRKLSARIALVTLFTMVFLVGDPLLLRSSLDTMDKLASVLGFFVALILGGITLYYTRTGGNVRVVAEQSAYAPGGSLRIPEERTVDGTLFGRQTILNELDALFVWYRRFRRLQFRPSRIQVVHGLGGCGKTTVAHAFAKRCQAKGITVWWVSAASAEEFRATMWLLMQHLGVSDDALNRAWGGRADAPALLYTALQAYRNRWLLVIDNADDPEVLQLGAEPLAKGRGWLRHDVASGGAILVTSRDGNPATWVSWCHRRELPMLAPDDAAQMLMEIAGERAGTLAEARHLAVRLAGLPLALYLCGTYLASRSLRPVDGSITTFTAYHATLDEGGFPQVFGPAKDTAAILARDVLTQTWEMSLRLLDEEGKPHARFILWVLATMATAMVPLSFLRIPQMKTIPQFAQLDELTLQAAVDALLNLGLLIGERHDDEYYVRLHPVVRDFSRYQCDERGATNDYIALVIALLKAQAYAGPLIIRHATEVFQAVLKSSGPQRLVLDAGDVLTAAIKTLQQRQPWLVGQGDYELVIGAYASLLGEEHPHTLAVRIRQAALIGERGNPQAAQRQLAALVWTCRLAQGSGHPLTRTAKSELGTWTGRAGDPVSAWAVYNELHTFLAQIYGHQHSETLKTARSVVTWLRESGDVQAARAMATALLQQYEAVFDANSIDVVLMRGELLECDIAAGLRVSPEQATVFMTLCKQVLGDHSYAIHWRTVIARHWEAIGYSNEAYFVYKVLLSFYREYYKPNDAYVVDALCNVVRMALVTRDITTAEIELGALETILGQQSKDRRLLVLQVQYGTTLFFQGQHAAAYERLQVAVPQYVAVVGRATAYGLYAQYHLLLAQAERTAKWSTARSQLSNFLTEASAALMQGHMLLFEIRYSVAHYTKLAGNLQAAHRQLTDLLHDCKQPLSANRALLRKVRRELQQVDAKLSKKQRR